MANRVFDTGEITIAGAPTPLVDETGEIRVDLAFDSEQPTTETARPDPGAIEIDLAAAVEPPVPGDPEESIVPVLPAVDAAEPAAPTAHRPVVQKPPAAALDLDSLISDLLGPEQSRTATAPSEAAPAATPAAAPDLPIARPQPPAFAAGKPPTPVPAPTSAPSEEIEPEPTEPSPPHRKPQPMEFETTLPSRRPSDLGQPPKSGAAADVPDLPLSPEEPPAIPSGSIAGLSADASTLRTLRKLAGGQLEPARARAALRAALRGEPYDRADIPDGRTIAIGLMRLLRDSGTSEEALVEAIAAVLDE